MFNLNLNLKEIDTGFQTPMTGDHAMLIGQIVPATAKPGAKDPNLVQLRIPLELLEPTQSATGKALPPGSKFQTNVTLPSESGTGEHDELRAKMLVTFIDAVLGTSQEAGDRPELNTEDDWKAMLDSFNGRVVLVTWKPAKDTQYGDTEVKGFKNLPTPA